MMRSHALTLIVAYAVLVPSSPAQRGGRHQAPVFEDETKLPPATYARPDPKLMLQQANDLKQMSAVIPGDIEGVTEGVISKDLGERLKKIEKLAKKLREEVQR